MDTLTSIKNKRSVRVYTDEILPKKVIDELLTLGTMASTGSNEQPWGFVVIQDKEEINGLSEEIKTHLLANMSDFPFLSQYKEWLENSQFSVFNHASSVLIIYGCIDSHYYVYDCTLAASNIMLAAHSMGIGTCWIGFAEYMLNTKAFKQKYRIPENYELVCPMSLGYKRSELTPPSRKKPVIFNVTE